MDVIGLSGLLFTARGLNANLKVCSGEGETLRFAVLLQMLFKNS